VPHILDDGVYICHSCYNKIFMLVHCNYSSAYNLVVNMTVLFVNEVVCVSLCSCRDRSE